MAQDGFQHLARIYAKSGGAIVADLNPTTAHLLHMAVGVSGEAGELLDAIKKCALYRKNLDRANVVEEIADIRFYLAGLMNSLNITEAELFQQEERKLTSRYASGGYSNQQAQDRADKA